MEKGNICYEKYHKEVYDNWLHNTSLSDNMVGVNGLERKKLVIIMHICKSRIRNYRRLHHFRTKIGAHGNDIVFPCNILITISIYMI